MQSLLRDIRYGFRSLVKSPGLTLVATVALTFGIGLTAVMFSIVYGALMKGLPFPDGHRIVEIERNNPARGNRGMSVPISDYVDYRATQHTVDALAAYYSGTVNVSGTGVEPERFAGVWVTASTFQLSQELPLLGRTIQPGEDTPGGPKVTVISYGMWQRRFGGDSAIVGKMLRANGLPYTIVGVMPEKSFFPDNAALWLPLQLDPLATKRGEGQSLTVVGRLKPGISVAVASADFNAIARRLQQQYKETNGGIGADVLPFVEAELGPEPRQLLYTMLGAVFFVLLISCANVANLLLDRAAHRSKEVGVRVALGASRLAVVRQFLSEAMVLAIAGGVLGTILAGVGIMLFNRAIVDTQPPAFIDIRLHPPVLLFVIGVSMLATVLSGAIPAFQSSRSDINEVLKDETRGSSSLHIGRMSRILVIFEIGLSCGLLVASGLMIKSVTKLRTMDPGFRTRNIFTARVGFPAAYTDTVAQRQFFEQLELRLGQLTGVRNTALSSNLPGSGSNGGSFTVDGQAYATPNDVPNARWLSVSPGFFSTFGIAAVEGRLLNAGDRADGLPVVVVNRAFVERYFHGKEPVGSRIRRGDASSQQPWMTIVGVVPTTYSGDAEEPRRPMFYAPLAQNHSNFVSMAVQTDRATLSLTPQVRQVVGQIDPDIPIYFVYSMDEALARPTWYIRVFGTMFMVFGVIALFLASVGLYAVMSFSVSRRIREMGIRMALGAQARDVIRMVLRQGVTQLAIGMVLGLGLAAGVAQLMQVILFQVQPRDPTIFGGVVIVLAATGLLACLIPARRATRVDPLLALRSE